MRFTVDVLSAVLEITQSMNNYWPAYSTVHRSELTNILTHSGTWLAFNFIQLKIEKTWVWISSKKLYSQIDCSKCSALVLDHVTKPTRAGSPNEAISPLHMSCYCNPTFFGRPYSVCVPAPCLYVQCEPPERWGHACIHIELCLCFGTSEFRHFIITYHWAMCENCHRRQLDSRFLPPQRCLLCHNVIDGCRYRRHLIACNEKFRQIENEEIRSRPTRDEKLPPKRIFETEYDV